MSEFLSWGSLKVTVLRGILPPDITVQVLAYKQLSPERYRMMLWDGEALYKNALLTSTSLKPPDKFSIIRLGTDTLPEGTEDSVIRKMMKEGEESFAYMFHHYDLIQSGAEVNLKIARPEVGKDASVSPGLNVATTPKSGTAAASTLSTPPNVFTPTTPPQPRARVNSQPRPTLNREAVKRNLEASYPPPPAKRQNTGDSLTANRQSTGGGASMAGSQASTAEKDQSTHPVSAINPHVNRYKIKVRVSQKKPVKEISSSRWQGKVASCILEDKSGSIQLTAFNEAAEELDNKLEMSKTYLVSGADVKNVRDTRWNMTGHNYELTWRQNTEVVGPITAGAVQTLYKFVSIADIRDLEKDKTCDVCAWVQSTEALREFRSRNDKDLKKREVTLADESQGGSSITLTLWDKLAVAFDADQKVIAVKGAKVGEWNGAKNLSIGFTGSYEVEPENERVKQLVDWSVGQLGATQLMPGSQLNNSGVSEPFITIQELKDELLAVSGEKRVRIHGSITKINEDNIFYRACTPADGTRCMKKVQKSRDGDTYECAKCGKRNILECDTTLRYNVRMSIADCTTSTWCNMFDATTLFRKSAKEMQRLMDEDLDKCQDYIKSRQLVPLVFHVSAKIETFNEAPKLKVIVNEVQEVGWKEGQGGEGKTEDWKELTRHQISEIHRLEAELGVAHDQLYGISWDDEVDLV